MTAPCYAETGHVTAHVTPESRVVTCVSRVTPPRAYTHAHPRACAIGLPRNGVTQVTTRVLGVTTAKHPRNTNTNTMTEEKKKGMREEMPSTAAWVDELRAVLGAEKVDAAIKAGMQARREHAVRAQAHGQRQADEWLARQKFPAGLFWACEGGNDIGIRRA